MNLRARYLNKTFTGVPFSLLNTTILAGKFQLLLDKFAGAAAAYSLRSLSKDTTNVVKVRRDSDNAERDFTATEVSDGTLEAWTKGTLSTTAPADYGSGAAAAYSLRVVSDSYTGPVVKVRRSDDNAEADFTAEEVSDGTLLAWVGTTASDDGFVTTWYDQSGNSNDATQATAASQPKIVDAGVLVTENGKAALDFDGGNDFLSADNVASVANGTNTFSLFFASILRDTTASGEFPWSFGQSDGPDAHGLRIQEGDLEHQRISDLESERTTFFNGLNEGGDYLIYSDYTGSTIRGAVNGSTLASSSNTNSINVDRFTIGLLGRDTNILESEFSAFELILYPSDQSANRVDIEGDINDYYGIYTAPSGFVTTWYDQSGNSNDATQATAASQPKIVDAGVLVTENGKAAIDFDGVGDNLTVETASIVSTFEDNPFSIFMAAYADDLLGDRPALGWNNGSFDKWFSNFQCLRSLLEFQYDDDIDKEVYNVTSLYNIGDTAFATSIWSNDQIQLWFNASDLGAQSVARPSQSDNVLTLGAHHPNTSDRYDGGIQEIIIYPSDQSANRVAIEQNIASYYGITLA